MCLCNFDILTLKRLAKLLLAVKHALMFLYSLVVVPRSLIQIKSIKQHKISIRTSFG